MGRELTAEQSELVVRFLPLARRCAADAEREFPRLRGMPGEALSACHLGLVRAAIADDGRGRFHGLARVAMRSAVLDLIRGERPLGYRGRRRAPEDLVSPLDPDLEPRPDDGPRLCDDREEARALLGAIPPALREVCLRRARGESIGEVAGSLGLPRYTAAYRYRRGLALMRARAAG